VLPAHEGRLRFGDLRGPRNGARLAAWMTGRGETRFHELGLDTDTVAERIVAGLARRTSRVAPRAPVALMDGPCLQALLTGRTARSTRETLARVTPRS
jgi:hypothetical protein